MAIATAEAHHPTSLKMSPLATQHQEKSTFNNQLANLPISWPFCTLADVSETSTAASSNQTCSASSTTDSSDFFLSESTTLIGSYIIYLEPDSESDFAKALCNSRLFLRNEYPSEDASAMFPFHTTLTSFFDIRASNSLLLRDRSRSDSLISFGSDWKSFDLSCRTTTSPTEELSNLSSRGNSLTSATTATHLEDVQRFCEVTRDTLTHNTLTADKLLAPEEAAQDSIVKDCFARAINKFLGKYDSPNEDHQILSDDEIELHSPLFEFEEEKPLSVKSGNIIIPWNLSWLTGGEPDHSGEGVSEGENTVRLGALCGEVEDLLSAALINCRISRTRNKNITSVASNVDGSESVSIPRKKRMHTTLSNRPKLDLIEHEEVYNHFCEILALNKGEVRWDLSVKQLIAWGVKDESHEFRPIFTVKNFARSRTKSN